MKAIVYQKYGSPDVLELREVEKPTLTDGKMLVRVHAASVNPLDWHFLRGTPFLVRMMTGLLKPKRKILGVDVAGRVEAVGGKVTQFQPGDEVFGSSDSSGVSAQGRSKMQSGSSRSRPRSQVLEVFWRPGDL